MVDFLVDLLQNIESPRSLYIYLAGFAVPIDLIQHVMCDFIHPLDIVPLQNLL